MAAVAAVTTMAAKQAMATIAAEQTAVAAVATVAATAVTGDRGVVAAHQSNADQSRKNGNSEDQSTIHPNPPTTGASGKQFPIGRQTLRRPPETDGLLMRWGA